MALFSIIIPAFNAQEFIEECLESILNQTYNNYEAIIIDDKSTDNTQEILKKYETKPNITVIYSKINQKAGGARNLGLDNAKGKYILFLDADDQLADQNTLKKLAEEIEKANFPELIYLGFKDSKKEYIPNEDPDVIKRLEEWMLPNVWDVLWEHNFIEKNKLRFEPHRYYEDFIFYYLGLINAKKTSATQLITHIYRDDNTSVTRKHDITKIRDYCYMTSKALELVDNVDEKFKKPLLKRIERNSWTVWKRIEELYNK